MAGLGGVLLGGQEQIVSVTDFQMLNSLVVLLLVTLGGASMVSGAFAGAVTYALFPVIQTHIPSLSDAGYLLTGLGAISIGRNPDGTVGSIAKAFDRWRDEPVRSVGSLDTAPALSGSVG